MISNADRNNNRGIENFNLTREIDLKKEVSIQDLKVLNDRDLFNKISNPNEEIDMSSFSLKDTYGMPYYNGQILNNKKSLLSNPFIPENNNKNNFISTDLNFGINDSYAEIDFDNNKKISLSIDKRFENEINGMAYNNIQNRNENIDICKIEKDIIEFEYNTNLKKNKEILVDISSPFVIGYLWKSLLLLSKNPSTDKLLNLLGIKNKDLIINDMKKHAEVFSDSSNLVINFPNFSGSKVMNTNYTKKLGEIYGIEIEISDEISENNVLYKLDFIFELELPFYYQPKIIQNYLSGFTKCKTKFLELTDVPVYLVVDKNVNIVNLEIPCASNMILGFLYSTDLNLLPNLPYDVMLTDKKPDHTIKKIVIPKINKKKQSDYGRRYKETLTQMHMGELVYGTLFDINIHTNMELNISVSKDVSIEKHEIKRTFDSIIINHKCFYYIKNKNIKNKILCTGMINY
jgi:hypothetical protein